MLGDFFTKPVQGNLFRKFKDAVMGHTHVKDLQGPTHSLTEKRVGIGQTGVRGNDQMDLKCGASVSVRNQMDKEDSVSRTKQVYVGRCGEEIRSCWK